MSIFLTGGSGFVGQNMIPELAAAGHTIYGLARSDASAAKVGAAGAIPVRGDLTAQNEAVDEALARCQAVVHVAAYMDFNYEKEKFYRINVDATQELLKRARKAGVTQFVFISAAAVVPGSPIVRLKESDAGPELPKALYPKTKALAERHVLASHRPPFNTISLRPPAIWGPNNPHADEMVELVEAGKWHWIGGSHQVLSMIHVRNLSAAVLAALASETGWGDAYFVTDGDRRSMRETFGRIFQVMGHDPG